MSTETIWTGVIAAVAGAAIGYGAAMYLAPDATKAGPPFAAEIVQNSSASSYDFLLKRNRVVLDDGTCDPLIFEDDINWVMTQLQAGAGDDFYVVVPDNDTDWLVDTWHTNNPNNPVDFDGDFNGAIVITFEEDTTLEDGNTYQAGEYMSFYLDGCAVYDIESYYTEEVVVAAANPTGNSSSVNTGKDYTSLFQWQMDGSGGPVKIPRG